MQGTSEKSAKFYASQRVNIVQSIILLELNNLLQSIYIDEICSYLSNESFE